MGKLEHFTNLNYGHLGMISRINYASRVRENSEGGGGDPDKRHKPTMIVIVIGLINQLSYRTGASYCMYIYIKLVVSVCVCPKQLKPVGRAGEPLC